MAKFLDLEGLNYFWEKIKSWVQERFAFKGELNQKQNTLISGQNIKTLNNQSILGSGNISIQNSVNSVNGKTGNVVLNAEDVGALPNSTTIPTKVSDLTNDSSFSSVSIDRKVSTGTNIADITIDGTTTQLYAPQGGSEGEENIIEIVKVNGTALIPDSNKAVDISVPNVPNWALQESKPTYDYSEIGNTPTIPTVPTNVSAFNNDAGYLTSHQDISGKENTSNKVTSFQSTPDDMHYPSEKLVKDSLDVKQDIIDSSHKLSADYIQDGTTNKVINVKPDWNAASGADAEILNKPTIPAAGIPNGGNAGQVLKKVSATDYDVTWANQSETLPSAYCTTSGSTAAKKANCSLYVTQANQYLQVLIGSANTYQGALTLNINSAGAKPIYINGTVSSSSNYTLPNGTYFVFYDGTNYYFRTDGKIQGPSGILYTKPSTGIPASDLASGVIPTVPVQDVTVGGTSVVNNGTAVIPAIPDTSGKEDTSNKVSTISGNETNTTKYPNTKAVADALGKWGVVSQTQTWAQASDGGYDYTMSDLVYGNIPQANIDLFESAGAVFNATSGYFELNGLLDISYEEMLAIYANSSGSNLRDTSRKARFCYLNSCRTIFPVYVGDAAAFSFDSNTLFYRCENIESISFAGSNYIRMINFANTFSNNFKLNKIIGNLVISGIAGDPFADCYCLEEVNIRNLSLSVMFKKSSRLSLQSVVYMVENAANTSAITITLHADALARCTADTTEYTYSGNTYTGIVALATAKNITLASA